MLCWFLLYPTVILEGQCVCVCVYILFFKLRFIWLYGVLVAAGGVSGCGGGSRVQAQSAAWGLSYSVACGILFPPPGIEPTSLALHGRFLTTGLPEKSLYALFLNYIFHYGLL